MGTEIKNNGLPPKPALKTPMEAKAKSDSSSGSLEKKTQSSQAKPQRPKLVTAELPEPVVVDLTSPNTENSEEIDFEDVLEPTDVRPVPHVGNLPVPSVRPTVRLRKRSSSVSNGKPVKKKQTISSVKSSGKAWKPKPAGPKPAAAAAAEEVVGETSKDKAKSISTSYSWKPEKPIKESVTSTAYSWKPEKPQTESLGPKPSNTKADGDTASKRKAKPSSQAAGGVQTKRSRRLASFRRIDDIMKTEAEREQAEMLAAAARRMEKKVQEEIRRHHQAQLRLSQRKRELKALFRRVCSNIDFLHKYNIIPDPESKDPYMVLGIPKCADARAIKHQYKTLALLLHPDKNKHPEAQKIFASVTAAYTTLK